MSQASKTRLAAILFSDIVDYSALMQRDRKKAIQTVTDYKKILQQQVTSFGGEVLNDYGDGSLSIFKSATDAVRCAMEMQRQFQNDPYVPLRIGIHIGEIIFENGQPFGDGVNIASRIESLGQPGTVFFSKNVYHQIRNLSDLKIAPLGQFEFKNIEEPIEVYALANEGFAVPSTASLTGKLRTTPKGLKMGGKSWISASLIGVAVILAAVFSLNHWPSKTGVEETEIAKSIAVLPFTDLSPESNQEYFSDGIADEILNALAQLNALQVTGRRSSFAFKGKEVAIPEIAQQLNVNYILDGSVRKMNDQLKVNAYLIDAAADKQIWSESYDRQLDDIFTIQNEIAVSIADRLKVSLLEEEKAQLVEVSTTNQKAYDLYLRGKWYTDNYLNTRNEREFENAIHLLQQAIDHDPQFALPYVVMGFAHFWKPGISNTPDSVQTFIEKALSLNPELSEAHSLQGWYFYEKGQFEKAKEAYEHSLILNPNNEWSLKTFGMLYFQQAEFEEAFKLWQRRAGLNFTITPIDYVDQGDFYLSIGDYEKAQINYDKSLQLQPDHAFTLRGLKWLRILQRRSGEAIDFSNQLIKLYPDNSTHYFDKASILALMQSYKEAVVIYNEGLTIAEENHSILQINDRERMYGYILWHNHQKEKAILHLKAYGNYCQEQIATESLFGRTNAYYDLASVQAFLGQKEEALNSLEQYAKAGFNFGLEKYIEIDPLFESIRNEKRFLEIVNNAHEDKVKIREKIWQLEEELTL